MGWGVGGGRMCTNVCEYLFVLTVELNQLGAFTPTRTRSHREHSRTRRRWIRLYPRKRPLGLSIFSKLALDATGMPLPRRSEDSRGQPQIPCDAGPTLGRDSHCPGPLSHASGERAVEIPSNRTSVFTQHQKHQQDGRIYVSALPCVSPSSWAGAAATAGPQE